MSKPKILVVDDCQTIRLAVNRILTEAGYSVVVAVDGEEALSKLSENPSLIVLDINMPGLDGFGFCDRLSREAPMYRDIPVVFLTTESSTALEMLGSEMGAYLKKPVCHEELLNVLEAKLQTEIS